MFLREGGAAAAVESSVSYLGVLALSSALLAGRPASVAVPQVARRDRQEEAAQAERIMGGKKATTSRTWSSRKETFPFQ